MEKKGRPKSIAFCRRMWIFQGHFSKKMKTIFHDSIFDHDDDHCEKNPFWLCDPQKNIEAAVNSFYCNFCKVVLGSQWN